MSKLSQTLEKLKQLKRQKFPQTEELNNLRKIIIK
jgi:hypothetical protein